MTIIQRLCGFLGHNYGIYQKKDTDFRGELLTKTRVVCSRCGIAIHFITKAQIVYKYKEPDEAMVLGEMIHRILKLGFVPVRRDQIKINQWPQLVDGQWYKPRWGLNTLQHLRVSWDAPHIDGLADDVPSERSGPR